MASATRRDDELDGDTGAIKAGYAAWKHAKLKRGLRQSLDRNAIIRSSRRCATSRLRVSFTPQARAYPEAIRPI